MTDNIKIGNFLVENGIVSDAQVNEAFELQKDNSEQVIGEILVTLGYLTKEEMIMALEMYLMYTDKEPEHVEEWLDQEEIDMLQEKILNNNKK